MGVGALNPFYSEGNQKCLQYFNNDIYEAGTMNSLKWDKYGIRFFREVSLIEVAQVSEKEQRRGRGLNPIFSVKEWHI